MLMKYVATLFALFFALCCAQFAAASSEFCPENAKQLCVLVRTRMDDSGKGPVGSATGTGFYVAPNLILTCHHLTRIPMRDGWGIAENMLVETRRGKFTRAKIVGSDERHDLVLLRLEESATCTPFQIAEFSMQKGDDMTIIGNFPEAIRVTKGELMSRQVMKGFAMGSAKVRSGFSGGPVIDKSGKVQGILSQRDDDNNSVFVRSDVIISLLKRYEKKSGTVVLNRSASKGSVAAEAKSSNVPPTNQSMVVTPDAPASPDTVIAVPVRRETADYH
jgi:S1-C subfamily serine protease